MNKSNLLLSILFVFLFGGLNAQQTYKPFSMEQYKDAIKRNIDKNKLTSRPNKESYDADESRHKIKNIKSIEFVKYGKALSADGKHKNLKDAYFNITTLTDITFINDACEKIVFENQEIKFPTLVEVKDYSEIYGRNYIVLEPKNVDLRNFSEVYKSKLGFSTGNRIKEKAKKERLYGVFSYNLFEDEYLNYSIGDINHCRNYLGALKYYDRNDNLLASVNYNGGYYADGKAIYYRNGKKFGEGQFDEGDLTGIWTFYNEDGSIHSKYDLKKGPEFIEAIKTSKVISSRKEKAPNGNYRVFENRELIIFPHSSDSKAPGKRTYLKTDDRYYSTSKDLKDIPFIVSTEEDPISRVYNSKNQLLNVGHLKVFKGKSTPYGITRHYHPKTGNLGAVVEYYRYSDQEEGKIISAYDLNGQQTVTNGEGVFYWYDKNGNETLTILDFSSETYSTEDDAKHEKAIKAIMAAENN